MGVSILVRQPTHVNIADVALVNSPPSRPGLGVTYWGNNYSWKPTGNPLQGWFTGVKGNRTQQLSNWPWMPGSTGVQLVGEDLGIMLQSWSLKKDLPARHRLGTIVLGANFKSVFPFRKSTGVVQASFDLKVPSSFVLFGGVSQVVAYLRFTDTKNKRGLWYGLCVFDSRGPRGDAVKWDVGTNSPIVGTSAGVPSSLQSGSTNKLASRKFNDYRTFYSTVNVENLRMAIQMLNSKYSDSYSTDPSDYSLGHANINPELYVPKRAYAHLGMSIRNWQVCYAD